MYCGQGTKYSFCRHFRMNGGNKESQDRFFTAFVQQLDCQVGL